MEIDMADDEINLPPRNARPAEKKKKVSGVSDQRKEKNAQRSEQEEARREEIIKLMKEHGFHVTDEAFLDFMGMHLETVSHVEKSIGRPTKYHPLLDDWAIWLGKRGYSLKQIASMMGVSYETLYEWGRTNATFSEALTRAREAAQNWWETVGQASLFSRDFNTFIWNKIISNRFRSDYTDRKGLPYDPKSPDEIEKVDDGVVSLDLRALTREQREILAIAIEGAQKQES
jgi:DNA-binding CsgD family transcriptional regulator